jgi:hypothetical protein
VLVYAMFPGYDGYDFIKRSDSIDIDLNSLFSSAPTCSIRGCSFIGEHQFALGTKIFLKAQNESRSDSGNQSYERVELANKVINYRILTAYIDQEKLAAQKMIVKNKMISGNKMKSLSITDKPIEPTTSASSQ